MKKGLSKNLGRKFSVIISGIIFEHKRKVTNQKLPTHQYIPAGQRHKLPARDSERITHEGYSKLLKYVVNSVSICTTRDT